MFGNKKQRINKLENEIQEAKQARKEMSRLLGAGTKREFEPSGDGRMKEKQIIWSWQRIISEVARLSEN